MQRVEIIFENKAKAEAFLTWLCECGEQYYFTDMENDAYKSVSKFTYHFNHLLAITSGQLNHCSEERE